MPSRHYGWHKAWSRNTEQQEIIQHESGLRFITSVDGVTVDESSLAAFAEHELTRGVSKAHLDSRLERLTEEAGRWHARNQPRN